MRLSRFTPKWGCGSNRLPARLSPCELRFGESGAYTRESAFVQCHRQREGEAADSADRSLNGGHAVYCHVTSARQSAAWFTASGPIRHSPVALVALHGLGLWAQLPLLLWEPGQATASQSFVLCVQKGQKFPFAGSLNALMHCKVRVCVVSVHSLS